MSVSSVAIVGSLLVGPHDGHDQDRRCILDKYQDGVIVVQLPGALPTLCAAGSRRRGACARCEKPSHVLPGDSTSPEAPFSMIGVDDLLGRHGSNIPASVYIANIPSVERGIRVVPVGNSGTVHPAGLFTWKHGAHVSRFDSCRHSRATVSASPSASCCAATLVRVAAHRNR